jgi:hypothetical protein
MMKRPSMLRFTAILTVLAGLLLGPYGGIGAGVAQEHETLTTPSLVVDLDTGAVLHAEAAGHPWYPASTAKLMTALITFQALKRGDVDLSTPVILSHNAMDQSAAYAGLKVGNAMTLEDALYAVLVGSANEVAVALAETVAGTEAAFVDLMNAQADRLGLTATHFTNPNGLFDQKQTVSARDLAVLGRDLFQVYPDYRRMFRTAAVTIDDKELISYNELITRYPERWVSRPVLCVLQAAISWRLPNGTANACWRLFLAQQQAGNDQNGPQNCSMTPLPETSPQMVKPLPNCPTRRKPSRKTCACGYAAMKPLPMRPDKTGAIRWASPERQAISRIPFPPHLQFPDMVRAPA